MLFCWRSIDDSNPASHVIKIKIIMLHRKNDKQKLLQDEGLTKPFTLELMVIIIVMILCIVVLVYGVMHYFLSWWKDSSVWQNTPVHKPW